MIRDVQPGDVEKIVEIYNYYIRETVITFDEKEYMLEEMQRKIKKYTDNGFPWLVYEQDGEVLGYAYLTGWRDRAAYNITAETSVYIDQKAVNRGIGSRLYEILIEKAKEKNLRSLIAGISVPNPVSRKLHQKFDFVPVGTFKECGKKFDRLIDVEFWQLFL